MSLFMSCKEFSSKTASGQLGADAGAYQRLKAALHLGICAHCRHFARNNATLDQALQGWRQHLQHSAPASQGSAPDLAPTLGPGGGPASGLGGGADGRPS